MSVVHGSRVAAESEEHLCAVDEIHVPVRVVDRMFPGVSDNIAAD